MRHPIFLTSSSLLRGDSMNTKQLPLNPFLPTTATAALAQQLVWVTTDFHAERDCHNLSLSCPLCCWHFWPRPVHRNHQMLKKGPAFLQPYAMLLWSHVSPLGESESARKAIVICPQACREPSARSDGHLQTYYIIHSPAKPNPLVPWVKEIFLGPQLMLKITAKSNEPNSLTHQHRACWVIVCICTNWK